jgi:hypothetical protein
MVLIYREQCSVYIDEFSERFVQALELYYRNDISGLQTIIEFLNSLSLSREPNNWEKLELLKARIAIRANDLQNALRYYGNLINHPYFGHEAQEYIDEAKKRR